MTLSTVLIELLSVVLTATLPVLTAFLVKFLSAKTNEAKSAAVSKEEARLIESIGTTITDAVTYVNQTFVDTLKNKGEFTKENQKIAFKLALDNIETTLTDKAKEFIASNFGDITNWLTTKIEACVKEQKSE